MAEVEHMVMMVEMDPITHIGGGGGGGAGGVGIQLPSGNGRWWWWMHQHIGSRWSTNMLVEVVLAEVAGPGYWSWWTSGGGDGKVMELVRQRKTIHFQFKAVDGPVGSHHPIGGTIWISGSGTVVVRYELDSSSINSKSNWWCD